MFRTMRRNKQQLPDGDCRQILEHNSSGVLAVSGDDGYPYAVPLSYAYTKGKLYFHCATVGHKLDALARCSKVSFCVIDQDLVVPEKYTTLFRSVIAFGQARLLTERAEMLPALQLLAQKYSPDQSAGHAQEIERFISTVAIIEMTIEHLSGKQCIELTTAHCQRASDSRI